MRTWPMLAALALLSSGASFAATDNAWSTRDYDLYPADFNADGFDDLLYVARAADKPSGIALSDGKSPTIAQQSWFGNFLGITWFGNHYRPIVGDFNGDGCADIFMQRRTPGDHYLLLTDCSKFRIVAINQTIPNKYLGQGWSADLHTLLPGDFDGDGRTDLLLQGVAASSKHSIFLADATGLFTRKAQQSWADGYLGFGWSAYRAVLAVGDFDGDGRDDVFVQARPEFATIDYDVPFQVPYWSPGAFGILLAKPADPSGAIFQLASIQQAWDANYLGALWSPILSNVVVGDFNGDGREDLLLQSKFAGRPTQWLPSNIAAQFTSLMGLAATNIPWSADTHRLVAANFNGGSAVGLYLQSTSASRDNQIAEVITGSAVSTTPHGMARLGVVTAQTAVGKSDGEFSVDEGGAANYRMPLRLPPGVAGMTPELSLAYNSRAGNGLIGQKWGLAGLSAISRCPTTWAVDGVVDAVDFDDKDKFCLDGQRLLVIAGATYGAVGAEYRTEIQSFQKIVSSGGSAGDPASFTVYTKAGQILEYGTTADSRVEAQGRTQALTWSLRRIRDRFDNFIAFTYVEDPSRSTNRPTAVSYGNASGTVVGSVMFAYETRTDATLGYIAGSVVGNDQRLSRIDIYGRPNQSAVGPTAASSLVMTYKLAYEMSATSGGSFLTSVTECDGASGAAQKCLGSTDFVWQHGYRGFSDVISTSLNPNSTKCLKPVDINNDGKIDYAFTNNGTWRYRLGSPGGATVNTGLTARNSCDAIAIDWDSDGYLDIAQQGPGSGSSVKLEVIRGTATGLSTTVVATNILYSDVDSKNTVVGDFNGDGRQDIVHPNSTLGALRLNGVNGLSNSVAVPLVAPTTGVTWMQADKPLVINLDGDAKDDLVLPGCVQNGWGTCNASTLQLIFLSFNPSTGRLEPVGTYPVPLGLATIEYFLKATDVNGDGLTDLLYWYNSQWQLLVATGTAGTPYTLAWTAASATYSQYTDLDWSVFDQNQDGKSFASEPIKTVTLDKDRLDDAEPFDYNRDGRMDIMIGVDGWWRVLISNGAGYDERMLTTERPTVNWHSASLIDVNADGLPDLFYPNSVGDDFRVTYGRGPAVSEVIEQISDGLGALTQIQYGVATDGNLYKGHTAFLDTGTQPSFPYANLSAPIPVVAKFSTDNGRSGGAVYTIYEYSGLKIHKQGRGLLGFAEVKSWNENAAIQTVNQYLQGWPYTGMLWTALQKLPDQAKYNTYLSGDAPPELRLNYAQICETAPVNCADISPAGVSTYPGPIVTKTVNTVSQIADGSGAVFPYVLTSDEYQYPLLSVGSTQPAPWKHTRTEYLNAAGNTASASYDAYGNPYRIRISVDNGSGGDVHTTDTQNYFTNDATNWILGRLLTAKVTHTRATYAGSGNSAPVTLTRVSAFTYNSGNGVLISETTEPATYTDPLSGGPASNGNGSGLWVTRTYGFDSTGNRTSEQVTAAVLSPASRTTSTTYDVAGQLPVSVTNALSQQEQQSWDPRFGVQLALTGPNGLTTQWQYDSFGRRLMETAPRVALWTATDYYWCALSAYCTDSRAVYAVRQSGSDGASAISEFDRLGREIRARRVLLDGREAIQDRVFDPLGRDFRVTAPYFSGESPCYTFRKYDALGRVISSWRPIVDTECTGEPDHDGSPPSGGQTTSFQYDEVAAGGAGLITTVSTSQSGAATRVVTKQTNVFGRLRFLKDVLGATSYVTEYDYDPLGNTSWVKDNAGNQTKLGYDVRGFKTSMIDPDMGSWSYGYDSLGQLTTQTDAKGQITTLGYDALGRMTSRVEKINGSTTESTTNWYYDDLVIGGPKAKGKLTKVVVAAGGYAGATGYEEQYVYDPSYGDLQDARRRIENEWFWISQSYDSLGRVDVIKYPNSVSGSSASSAGPDSERVKARQNYNAYGYLSSVSDPDTGTVYWSAVSNDAGGAILREDLGNGLSTLRTVGRASGLLATLTTGVGVGATVQNLSFDWDGAGNLVRRTDLQANKKEEFDYDGLYRMTQSRLFATSGGTTPSTTDNYSYDSLGNLTNKGGAAGAYTYANYNYGTRTGCADTVVRPHAVYQVTVGAATRRYCYDANGNLTAQSIASGSGSTRYDSSTWWVANLAKRISQSAGSTYSDFWYGPGRERIRQLAQKSGTTSEDTRYVGGLYEKLTRTVSGTPSTESVHYIRAGSQAVAVVKRISGSLQTRYLHRDHLGSVVALTDPAGAVVERYSYDPWGKRRDPATWVTPAPGTFSFDPAYSDRGYTGHEHIDHLGLVNMNGRLYDPELGKFLSADPTTQFPESTQGWNRYAYCGNNPLSYTDPSGFSFLKSLMKLVGIVMSVFAPQFTPLWQQLLWSFAAGFLSSGGNLQGGLMAMVTLGVGRWAGAFARAGPAVPGASPGFNPNLMSLGERAAEEAAKRSTSDQILEVARRAVEQRVWDDGSGRTNADRKLTITAVSPSFERLYSHNANSIYNRTPDEVISAHPEIVEAAGWMLIVIDVADTVASPGPDVGIVGAELVAGARVAKAARAGGRLGGTAHRATVAERAAQLEREGHTITAGGGRLPERSVITPDGKRRFPDISSRDPSGNPYHENVGRSTASGDPIARERRALEDIRRATGTEPGYTPYDR